MAPGVTTKAITRNAPTVCIAATTDADSKIKNKAFSSLGLNPMVLAWFSSKKVTKRSFHLAVKTNKEIKPIMKLKVWLINVANMVLITKRRDCKIIFVSRKLNILY